MANMEFKLNGEDFTSYFSDYKCKNVLTYVTEPTRTRDFSLQNDEVDAGYVPQFEGKLGYLTLAQFSKLIQGINTKGFYFSYYDYELMKVVKRKMYCTSSDLNQIYNYGLNLKGLVGVTITFVGKYGYDSYSQLLNEPDDSVSRSEG